MIGDRASTPLVNTPIPRAARRTSRSSPALQALTTASPSAATAAIAGGDGSPGPSIEPAPSCSLSAGIAAGRSASWPRTESGRDYLLWMTTHVEGNAAVAAGLVLEATTPKRPKMTGTAGRPLKPTNQPVLIQRLAK